MAFFNRNEPPAPPVEPAAPAPNPDDAPVTRAEFSKLDATLSRLAESFEANANRPVVVNQAAPAAPPKARLTDAEINERAAAGDVAGAIRALAEERIGEAESRAATEIGAVRDYGTTMLGTLADRAFVATLDADDKRVFTKYEKEIRALVGQCEPALRGHPDTWQACFNNVTGIHRKELENERLEQELRRRAEDDEQRRTAPMPGAGGRARGAAPGEGADDVPTIQEVAGEFAGRMGDMTDEDFIRRINRGKRAGERYKDFADYMKRGQEIDARLAAIGSGDDDGGQGPLPNSLRP